MAVDAIRVAVSASRGLVVHATGRPARVVSFGAAAGVVFMVVAASYGTYEGVRALLRRIRRSDHALAP
jgi:hypothetical protein